MLEGETIGETLFKESKFQVARKSKVKSSGVQQSDLSQEQCTTLESCFLPTEKINM